VFDASPPPSQTISLFDGATATAPTEVIPVLLGYQSVERRAAVGGLPQAASARADIHRPLVAFAASQELRYPPPMPRPKRSMLAIGKEVCTNIT